MSSIKDLRQARGLTAEALAASAGIPVAAYYDIEDHPDELHIAASVDTIARIAWDLGVKPSTFYQGTASGTMSLDELTQQISKHLSQTNESLSQLEARVGWDLAVALEEPSTFRDFPAVGLRDVCACVGVNWLDVLDGLVA